jgi:RHS repeat-associated protein
MNNNSPQTPDHAAGKGGQQAAHSLDRYTVQPQNNDGKDSPFYKPSAPTISLPKGGGALKGIDEKFSVNAVNGTAGLELPLPLSPGRGGFSPSLAISYNSGSGNSAFGLGWNLGLPSIQRKTDKKLPQYRDDIESDVFLLAGAEDLVPKLKDDSNDADEFDSSDNLYHIKRYVPRIEGLFARIEYIRLKAGNEGWWRVTTKDNITTYYGLNAEARIADPENASRIFQWLPQVVTDHKGNVQLYQYVAENNKGVAALQQVHEKNRLNDNAAFANTYLKRVKYCNEIPWFVSDNAVYRPDLSGFPAFMMEGVLDYGDHITVEDPEPKQDWLLRNDPFSSFHAGFEIRTYRKCKRVKMFHYFEELNYVIGRDYQMKSLIRTLDLNYTNDGIDATLLTEADMLLSAKQTGYVFDTYHGAWQHKSLPEMSFDYEPLKWDDNVQEVSAKDFTHAPQGLTGPYQWIDFEGEGISGILTEQATGWFYKNNLGDGHFTPAKSISPKPSFSGLGSNLQWQDLDADGHRQVVAQEPTKGFWELGDDQQWAPFRTFPQELNINWDSPFTKMLDLDGDGRADILITEDRAWTWYHNDGKEGYSMGGNAAVFTDEEKGPLLLLRDTVQSIFLADMNGDGITDLVRIKNGEVCYWPNMGYGKFGAKVTMNNTPIFTTQDNYNPQYLTLADISGTGAADIIYLGNNTCTAYINLAGNGWSNATPVSPLPGTDPYSKIAVLDFLGNGTGCLVWSSALPQHAHAPLRYIDLMGGKKPYLMRCYHNGMGKRVSVTYKTSTQYYLEDKRQGYPWATLLPFPVHCISKVCTYDEVSETTFTQSYKYRHGYYDHEEREFRGFGYVETLDVDAAAVSENEALDQAPVLTKTWNHTGAWMRQQLLTEAYKAEYFQFDDWDNNITIAEMETGLKAQELREAHRALKGSPLRQEVYALDGSHLQGVPYSVTATSYSVQKIQGLQPVTHKAAAPSHAVFLSIKQQSIAYSTERDASDPRVMQELTLKTDRYGNVLKSAQVAYGRLHTPSVSASFPQLIIDEQKKMHITFTESEYTNSIRLQPLRYRLRVPYESKSYELTGFTEPLQLWTPAALLAVINTAEDLNFAAQPTTGIQKRLLSHQLTRFRKNNGVDVLPLGKLHTLAIPDESYTKAFTALTIDHCYGTPTYMGGMAAQGGYVDVEGDGLLWIPSGKAIFDNPLTNFFTPKTFVDPWGKESHVSFGDSSNQFNYWLIPQSVTDALGNVSTVQSYDWRILQPKEMKDINNNISEILYDQLGLPVAMAVKGKGSEGDSLTVLDGSTLKPSPNLYDFADVEAQGLFFDNPEAHAGDLLATATWRCVYNFEQLPMSVGMIARATHVAALGVNEVSELVVRLSYSDALGRVIMHKARCEPATVVRPGEDGEPAEVICNWVGSGRTVYNNKGKAVMQYEPYFSETHECDTAEQAGNEGVSPKMFYDPLGRVYRTEMPDGSFSKTEWTSWQQTVWDNNDTVVLPDPETGQPVYSDWYKDRITTGSMAGIPEEAAAAVKALAHTNTPTLMHTDSLARPFYTIQQDSATTYIHSYVTLDIQGNRLSVTDGNGHTPLLYQYNMLQQPCYQFSKDSGTVVTFTDVAGQPLWAKDAMGKEFVMIYDELRRVTQKWLAPVPAQSGDPAGKLLEFTVYGDITLNADLQNLRGQVMSHLNGSGKQWMPLGYDFKGNPVVTKLVLLADKTMADPDWNTLGFSDLDTEEFSSSAVIDALGRPTKMTDPGGNETAYVYDAGGALKKVLFRHYAAVPPVPNPFAEYVKDIRYDAKGQRQSILYGNNTVTSYTYDPKTYRLRRLLTTANSGAVIHQDLKYYYDPVGNITFITDAAQKVLYHDNHLISPDQDFTYDALYRLIKAKGREMAAGSGQENNWENAGYKSISYQNDIGRNYCQYYEYDAVGNIKKLRHVAGAGSYTRYYKYVADTNRLWFTSTADDDTPTGFSYTYDLRGNMDKMQHLSDMQWNISNELNKITGGGIDTCYQYSGGQRIRKYTDKGTIKEERIYLGSFEIYRKFDTSSLTHPAPVLERHTLHISDDTGRIAMIEKRTIGTDPGDAVLTRYIYSNHLQSATLELNEDAEIISYEEYHPYGTTAYTYQDADVCAVAKRYRYTGKERDEESGLYYHGARYYVAWLGRWCAVDPKENERAGSSPYDYCSNDPVNRIDPDGMKDGDPQQASETHKISNAEVASIKNWAKSGFKTGGGTPTSQNAPSTRTVGDHTLMKHGLNAMNTPNRPSGGSSLGVDQQIWHQFKKFDPVSAGIIKGGVNIVSSAVEGIVNIVAHPVNTVVGLGKLSYYTTGGGAFTPEGIQFYSSLAQAGSHTWDKFKNGDAYTKTAMGTEVVGNIALFFVGLGEAKAATNAGKVSELMNAINKTDEIANAERLAGVMTKTDAGFVFGSDQNTINNMNKMIPKDGTTQVLVHGNVDGFTAGSANPLDVINFNAKTMAKTMFENGYVKGTPVDLISCSTGICGDGAAYELSRYLRAPVSAPSNLIQVTNSGGYLISDLGRMRIFFNGTIR